MTQTEPVSDELDDAGIPSRRRYISGIAAFLGGPANVIMQLSMAPVGYGVVESTVDSGRFDLHPLKRGRTTLTYLAVAMLGTAQERRHYREEVNRQHRQVRSTESSPVRYNAFDPELQLWVAACIYYGVHDAYTLMYGPLDDEVADGIYRESMRFGTTLQMRPEQWPADRAAFAQWWQAKLPEIAIDARVAEYLVEQVVDLAPYPRYARLLFARMNRWFTTGFLPQPFRDQLGLSFTPAQQRRFERVMRGIGRVHAVLPEAVRLFPFNIYLRQMRQRIAAGLPLV